MITPDRLSQLVQEIYAAAETPFLWRAFMEQACEELGAHAATMGIISSYRTSDVRLDASFGWEPADLETWLTEWAKKDPWFPAEKFRSGQVVPSQAICPDKRFESSECYNEFYRKRHVYQGMGGVVDISDDVQLVISFQYPKSSAPCGNEQLQTVGLLIPHLRQAVQIYRQLQGRELTETAMTEFLEHLPVGFITVGLDRRVVRMNREARRILREQDGLGQANGALRTWLSRDEQALQYLIRSSTATTDQNGTSPGGLVEITRRSGKAAYQAIVTPLSPTGRLFETHRAVAVLLLTDPARSPKPRIAALRRLFGFTPAEARIALALLEGRQTGEIANNLRITQNTLRTHLKSLYSKAGARGQGDLIRLLLRSAAVNWEDQPESISLPKVSPQRA